jgi:hypothetical protein
MPLLGKYKTVSYRNGDHHQRIDPVSLFRLALHKHVLAIRKRAKTAEKGWGPDQVA